MSRNDETGDLSTAFMNDDRQRILSLTEDLPLYTRSNLHDVAEVFKKGRAHGMTPLLAAMFIGSYPLCERLISDGVDMGQHLEEDFNSTSFKLQQEDKRNHLDLNDVLQQDFHKTTPMFWAIKSRSNCLIEMLVKGGHKIDSFVEKIQGMPALSFAIFENNLDAVKELLKLSADIHASDFILRTPLDVAIDKSLPDMVNILLQHGEDVNCRRHQGSPLLRAISNNNLAMVEYLVGAGANINVGWVNTTLICPLNAACTTLSVDIAMYLIAKGVDTKGKDFKGETGLHGLTKLKIENRSAQKIFLARALIDNGADINAKNVFSWTPLMGAVHSFTPELVSFLLSVGADVNSATDGGHCPLHIAIQPSLVVEIHLIYDLKSFPKQPVGPEDENFIRNQFEVVNLLLKYGANFNAKLKTGHSPLHIAIEMSTFKIIQLLVEAGSNVNDQDAGGRSPFLISVARNDLNIAKFLIERGANVNIKDNQSRSTLEIALSRGSLKMIKLLIKAGVDVNEGNEYESKPLHFASRFGNYKIGKLLIEGGADINVKDKFENTPFSFAIAQPEFTIDFLKLFLNYGLDPHHTDGYGLTPYHYTMGRGDPELLKEFWRHGCPYDIPEIEKERKDFVFAVKQRTLTPPESAAFWSLTNDSKRNKLLSAQAEFMVGVINNKVDLVLNALDKGAVAGSCSREVQFPLHYVTQNGYHEVAKTLLRRGVSANSLNNSGRTPLQLVNGTDVHGCKLLLKYGACYQHIGPQQLQQSKQLRSLLQTIKRCFQYVKKGDSKVLDTLRKCVADKDWDTYYVLVNCVDSKGNTLMALAVLKSHFDISKVLIKIRLEAPTLD